MASIEDILTLAEAAELLGLSPDTLRNQMKRGRLAGRLIGKTYVTTRDEVERYRLESLGQVGRPPSPIFLRDEIVTLYFGDEYARAQERAVETLVRRVTRSARDLGMGVLEYGERVTAAAATLGLSTRMHEVNVHNIHFTFTQA